MRPRSAALLLGGAVALVGLAESLTAVETSGTAHDGLRRYALPGISFSYPAAWFRAHSDANTMSSNAIVTLSSQRISVDCKPYIVTGKPTLTGRQYCVTRAPAALKRDGIYVNWVAFGNPTQSLRQVAGRAAKVGGDRAKIQTGHPGTPTCAAMGGQEQIQATIATARANFLLVEACMRGPDLKAEADEFSAMLRSTRLRHR